MLDILKINRAWAFLFFLYLSCVVGLEGALEGYFKKIHQETADLELINPFKKIDYIYLINLDQRPQKWRSCIEQLEPYQIRPFRFSAVNGWELGIETLNELGVQYDGAPINPPLMGTCYLPDQHFEPFHELIQAPGRTYYCHCMSRGAIGIVLSHLSILQDAYDRGFETIWVMEDDIEVIKNPLQLDRIIARLDHSVGPANWDILFTDQDTKGQDGKYVLCLSYARRPNFEPNRPERFAERKEINKLFKKVGARYGAYSMIVRRSGMKKLLDFFKTYSIFLPYDCDFCMPDTIQLVSLKNDIVSTKINALSDNGAPNYKRISLNDY